VQYYTIEHNGIHPRTDHSCKVTIADGIKAITACASRLLPCIALRLCSQDRYVPHHSARLSPCEAARRDGMRGQAAAEMLECSLKVRVLTHRGMSRQGSPQQSCMDQEQCAWSACSEQIRNAGAPLCDLSSWILMHRALGLSLHLPSCCGWMSTLQPAVLGSHPVAAQKAVSVMELLCHQPAHHRLHHLACPQPSVT
jgi:hypothetical protein